MPIFRYDKLVRDRIEELHVAQGHIVDSRVLTGDELRKALCDKITEEADEVRRAKARKELIEEIADLQQIVDAIRGNAGVSAAEVDAAKQRKADVKGAFEYGIYISTVTIPVDDPMTVYLRRAPEKYPEVSDESM